MRSLDTHLPLNAPGGFTGISHIALLLDVFVTRVKLLPLHALGPIRLCFGIVSDLQCLIWLRHEPFRVGDFQGRGIHTNVFPDLSDTNEEKWSAYCKKEW